ncbi:Bax inhibitor-1/YccA family protein [Herbiconiux sp. CPCC 203407]|uniref:Bax inhibitor-1/YccA family protein n=1 Tax=Herbiconiux oxytropis TaxID=2970915 RepID=A0AA42BVR3_9MICO|nr:Bax inhibitor-1/YccA family protein [Herbiconiux oxytropis]MCS5721156.1 Bax inhibitor-1/YccA family protein [Herbiconiux oxytropis]MCS5724808.1 Bax inhibitor-1/YccA family protein [Herbiconiux oxytropis]
MAGPASSSNPAFSRNPVFNGKEVQNISAEGLQTMFDKPAATPSQTDRMSYDGVILKTAGMFVVLLVTATVSFLTNQPQPTALGMGLTFGGAIIGLVLGLVNAFKREPSVPLIMLYAAFQGLFIGGISSVFESQWSGIIVQAVLATLAVFGVTLALFASGKIRASKRATKVFLIAIIGYGLFSLLNFVLMITGVVDDPWGLRGATIGGFPIGIVIGLFAVLLAAYSLVLDFDSIQRGVKSGAPRKYEWSGAFGLVLTLIWLYLELLRIIAIFRN